MTGIGSVMGLVVGGALTEVSWRLAFLVNVPLGVLMIVLARNTLRETHKERMKLDAAGALLATVACTAAVFGFTQGPENGWMAPLTLLSAAVAVARPSAPSCSSNGTRSTRWCRSVCSVTAIGWPPSPRCSWPAA